MVLILLLILLNGFFSLSEVVLITARKLSLQKLAEKQNKRAKIALYLVNRPEIFLATVQIAITLIAILTGYFSLEVFKPYIDELFLATPLAKYYASEVSSVIVVILVTYATSLAGELIPKRLGIIYANKLALFVALPMWFVFNLSFPLVWLLSKSSNVFFSTLGIKNKHTQQPFTEQEIKSILFQSEQQGNIDEEEREIIERIFSLGDRNITSLMLHRQHITYLEKEQTIKKARTLAMKNPHYDYPVCEEGFDNLKGIVSLKNIFTARKKQLHIKDIMRPAITVPENISAYSALEEMRKNHQKTCFVVDEYGSVEGMLTLTHILEGMVGDIPDQKGEKPPIVQRKDGSYLVDGPMPFYEFLEHFDKSAYHEKDEIEADEYDTVAGFVIFQLGHIPKEGEKITWNEFSFEVIDMDGHRVDKLAVSCKSIDQGSVAENK